MRIRQIKPEFFRDKDMAALPFRARITYIGLWLVADDAGWFDCDRDEIALALYGYDGCKAREHWVTDDLLLLIERGHVEVWPCGHAQIPTLTEHQRLSGGTKRVETCYRQHRTRCCVPVLIEQGGSLRDELAARELAVPG